ncbi:C1 family peptidase [Micromonospora echinofusca]|uniref:Peptidase n=1 Tax=Micromonospora echinofusca TaxID=47858 RepID=A0ABS3VSJ6_MICEH|nr:C1 family peptidase [Micromonospora echinofusca]MBO4207504.1 peptidase [Micromonospora echinofusca]
MTYGETGRELNPPVDLAALRSTLERERASWRMAETSVTALTEAERVIRLGVPVPPDFDPAQIDAGRESANFLARAALASAFGAPTSFDLRDVGGINYSTPIRDQGNCGSCVAFGVAATMEHVLRYSQRDPNLVVDLSEAHLFYCHGRADGRHCRSGWLPEPALGACCDKGVTTEECYPYTAGDQNCTGLDPNWQNSRAVVTQWQDVSGNPASMKRALALYGSIVACMYVYQDFYAYRTGVYRHLSGELAGGHCVTLIGYDDVQGCWIGKNSWGTNWGDGGFFRIAYGECGIEQWHTCEVQGVRLNQLVPVGAEARRAFLG